MLDNFITPSNARVDILSSTFGRAADFEEELLNRYDEEQSYTKDERSDYNDDGVAIDFSPTKGGRPVIEPHFGTNYWSHKIPKEMIEEWTKVAEPKLPSDSQLSLPPLNPFVPQNFQLKSLPADDSHHPLLFCCLKLCISVGKKKVCIPVQCLFQCLSIS